MEIRQIQIKNDKVGRVECRGLQAIGGVLGLDHGEAMKFEAGTKKPPYLRFVIDQQDDVGGFIHWSAQVLVGGQDDGGRGSQSVPAARHTDAAAVGPDEGRRDPKSQTGSGDGGLMALAAE